MLALPNTTLILGSSSPRRQELLSHLNLPYEVIKPGFEERLCPGESPERYVVRNAEGKALWIARYALPSQPGKNFLIISADTIVVLKGEILEKPKSKEEACSMLQKLSQKTHTVFTGLTMVYASNQHELISSRSDIVESKVSFKKLSPEEIASYVATGEPMDKAGSYAVQGKGSYMVQRIDGSYTNIMGLPLTETFEWLRDFVDKQNQF